MNALACLVAEPERHGVALSTPDTPRLVTLALRYDLDLVLAAQLARTPYTTFMAWNPGSFMGRQPRDTALLLPIDARRRLRAALRDWPRNQRAGWSVWRADGRLDWAALASGSAFDAAALAQLHDSATTAPAPGTIIALPPSSAHAVRLGLQNSLAYGQYVVRAGDSLWLIARRHDLRVADLLAWNNLTREAVLRPGQRLRVAAP